MQIISLNIPKSARVYSRSLSSLVSTPDRLQEHSAVRAHVSLIIPKSSAVNVLEKLNCYFCGAQSVRIIFNGKPYLKNSQYMV